MFICYWFGYKATQLSYENNRKSNKANYFSLSIVWKWNQRTRNIRMSLNKQIPIVDYQLCNIIVSLGNNNNHNTCLWLIKAKYRTHLCELHSARRASAPVRHIVLLSGEIQNVNKQPTSRMADGCWVSEMGFDRARDGGLQCVTHLTKTPAKVVGKTSKKGRLLSSAE